MRAAAVRAAAGFGSLAPGAGADTILQLPRSDQVVAGTTDWVERTKLLPASVEIMLAAGDREQARRACGELEAIGSEVRERDAARARWARAGGGRRWRTTMPAAP